MTSQQLAQKKPPLPPRAKWRRVTCQCRNGMLLCFGLPLLPPSAILLGIAFGTETGFGVFHAVGLVLTIISLGCISAAVAMTMHRKRTRFRSAGTVSHIEVPDVVVVQTTPRNRPSSSASSTTSPNGTTKLRKLNASTLATESDKSQRPRKKRKRKQEKSKVKLAPVKEEDGRARFEKDLAEREASGRKFHKRTKSESRKGIEMFIAEHKNPVQHALTRKHLKNLALHDNQGSQESLQLKRSMSLSDIGDSASERLSMDFADSPQINKKFHYKAWPATGLPRVTQ